MDMLKVAVNVGKSVDGSTSVAGTSRASRGSNWGFRATGTRLRETAVLRIEATRKEANICGLPIRSCCEDMDSGRAKHRTGLGETLRIDPACKDRNREVAFLST